MKGKVYGYIRVSTETQADKGYGLETQKNAITEYCKTNDLELIETFTDAGKSGAIGDKDDLSGRPALIELLSLLNRTNTVIVMHTSRLWRDEAARVLICRTIKKSGGDIISIEQPRYTLYNTDPQEFLFNSLMEMLDQYDRMCINIRLNQGKNTKARSGYKPSGKAPFGYKWSYDRKTVEINEEEAAIVQEIFQLTYDLCVSKGEIVQFQKIANILNKRGKYNQNNSKWTRQGIDRILKNKFYAGILTHQGIEFEGKHQALVELKIWNEIQSA